MKTALLLIIHFLTSIGSLFAQEPSIQTVALLKALKEKNYEKAAGFWAPDALQEFLEISTTPDGFPKPFALVWFGNRAPEIKMGGPDALVTKTEVFGAYLAFNDRIRGNTIGVNVERFEIIGEIPEGDRVTHVLVRSFPKKEDVRADHLRVVSYKKVEDKWKVILDGDTRNMIRMLGHLDQKEEEKPEVEEEAIDDEVSELVDEYSEADLNKAEEIIKKFLTAKTVEEKKRYVRDPDRVGPFMEDYYSKSPYEPEGFDSMDHLKVTFRHTLVLTAVTTGDFLTRGISLERFTALDKETYRVDWESWVAYSEKTPEEMRSEKPVEPFLIRPRVSLDTYYNYDFSDDEKWQAYDLEMNEGSDLFTGYVPKGSDLDKALGVLKEQGKPEPYILKVVYPKEARANNQVEIIEIIEGDGWIFDPPKPKKDPKEETPE